MTTASDVAWMRPSGRTCDYGWRASGDLAPQTRRPRAAINAPIQGTAADIIRRGMIRIPSALEREGLSARMLLQVHDELLFEVTEAEADATIAVVKHIMESAAHPAVHLDVPLTVDAGKGATWAQAH